MEYKVIYKLNKEVDEIEITGAEEIFLKAIESRFKIQIFVRSGEVSLKNEDLAFESGVVTILNAMEMLVLNDVSLSLADVYSIINNIDEDNCKSITSLYLKKDILISTVSGKTIYPKTLNQKIYLNALENNDIVFAIGPAGTGKTYLAVMFAIKMLKSFKARKIVLVRPIVEAGEKLGFLPGDLKEKVDPYLIPIYDSLYEAMGKETITKFIEKGTIEVAPLAYMRGRTLENSIIILDEAQNAQTTQMKMFLTRLGFNSKMIITGDLTQIDLPNKSSSGLIEATDLLEGVPGIKIIKFQREDVMRHPLVFKIIEKYDNKR